MEISENIQQQTNNQEKEQPQALPPENIQVSNTPPHEPENDREDREAEKSEGEEVKKHHKHHKHHHHKHHHKKHRSKRSHPEKEVPGEYQEEDKDIDELEKKATKESKKEAEQEKYREMIEGKVDELIMEMERAFLQDKENKKLGKLSIEKLKLLPKVKSELKKIPYHDPFLLKNGCHILVEWLKKHEDGTLPCIDVIEGIIDILDDLPIDNEILRECKDLGRTVMEIYKTHESMQLRMKAKRLCDKWFRDLFEIDLNYQSVSDVNHNYVQFQKHINAARKKAHTEQSDKDKPTKMLDFEEIKGSSPKNLGAQYSASAKLLHSNKTNLDFIHKPVSEIVPQKKKDEPVTSSLMKKILQVKRVTHRRTGANKKGKII